MPSDTALTHSHRGRVFSSGAGDSLSTAVGAVESAGVGVAGLSPAGADSRPSATGGDGGDGNSGEGTANSLRQKNPRAGTSLQFAAGRASLQAPIRDTPFISMPSLPEALAPVSAGVLPFLAQAGSAAEVVAGGAAEVAGDAHHAFELHSLLWTLPFAGLLLSIAVWPLAAPNFWHRHYGKISAAWVAAVVVPLLFTLGASSVSFLLLEVLFEEYIPFIILLTTLFALSGGVRIHSRADGTPNSNLAILGIGTFIAGFVGTTGASMLLIRPLLRANQWRTHRVHTVIFFIFLVSNIGGSLTPLGDPPLFLGFLNGVPFFWPTRNLLLPMLLVALPLLLLYRIVDQHFFKREKGMPMIELMEQKFSVEGAINLGLLLVVLGVIILTGIWNDSPEFNIHGVPLHLNGIVRDLSLVACLGLSLVLTKSGIRKNNHFTWEPMLEVAKLFAGIFIALVPMMILLSARSEGSLGFIIDSVSDEHGEPINLAYFWITGLLSAFLDNAPTYLLFFNVASGDAEVMIGALGPTLLAISTGAVFMGAFTYIGNAPNLMVRGVAREWDVALPSFFGYMAWAAVFLLPLFLVMSLVFFL